ncbi:MAG: exosortase/archaeosortase family protein [Opitutaceae bacterium]|jgi:exosortase
MSEGPLLRATAVGFVATAGLAGVLLIPLGEVWRQSPDLRHGWAAALLVIYLWWERQAERPPTVSRERLGAGWWVAAAAIGLMALPLRLLLTPFSLWTTVLWAYMLLVIGAAAMAAWLRAGREGAGWLLSPCIILASALPWPASFEQGVILPLRGTIAALAAEVSNLLGHPALAVGTSVRLASGWVGIDEACGGIRSLQACVMIALFFGEWFRFSWVRRIVLVACGVGSALVGNFSRVLFLSLKAGDADAIHRAHDAAGWVALVASLALTALIAFRWAGYRLPVCAQPASRRVMEPRSLAGAWLAVVVGMLALNEAGTRWWFARGQIARADIPQWTVSWPEEEKNFVREPLGEIAAEMLRPDAYTAGRWQEGGQVEVAAYYIEWWRGQVARFLPFLHNPTVCMPMAGCELVASLGDIDVSWTGGRIPFHAYKFRRAGEELWVAFTMWDPSRGQPLGKPSDSFNRGEWWRDRWREVAEGRENQPAQLFTLAIMGGRGEAVESLKTALERRIARP